MDGVDVLQGSSDPWPRTGMDSGTPQKDIKGKGKSDEPLSTQKTKQPSRERDEAQRRSQTKPESVDLINLHGFGTPPYVGTPVEEAHEESTRRDMDCSQQSLSASQLLGFAKEYEDQTRKAARTGETQNMDEEKEDQEDQDEFGSRPRTDSVSSREGAYEGIREYGSGKGPVGRAELDIMLGQFEARITEKVEKSNLELKREIAKETRNLFEQYDQSFQAKFRVIDTKILGLEDRFQNKTLLDKERDRRIEQLEQRVGIMASAKDAEQIRAETG